MLDRLESAWHVASHALQLVAQGVVAVDPRWLAAGVVLHLLNQVVRTRGWFNIIRAAYPGAHEIRARDVTLAYLAGAGLNGVAPARGGDVVKIFLLRRRAPETRWSTLLATLLPETLFESAFGCLLVAWAVIQGWLPVPTARGELPWVDVSLLISHPLISAAAIGLVTTAALLLAQSLRGRASELLARLRLGLAILDRPRDFLRGVVIWQALGRLIRLGSLACFLAAFALPLTPATVVLVMAAQSGTRILPIAPASAGLRIAMLAYGFASITGEAVDITRITAFSFGVGAALYVTALAISVAILGREFGTTSPRRLMGRVREQLAAATAREAPAEG
jgi:Lysylphosphatidylglycerol synthase TM region